ncbi:xanthine dehydrogenase family protein subunit M [Bacillus sp. AFS041924]|uniref:FAD binding domain-containing protein n=1 Tax=Bacillus sp. AFS041924 TaxID=2033503 RepID=UPI000BFE7C7C|nr:xanthine dehydrogenase family protein subunit M [Bacillus sp. AFS041924]PGS48471.1 molybdopterin dehydrogenase [Bacillus sp. AFS041924]
MKPAAFNYLRPTDLEEALGYLSEYGEDAKILSGGQSLIPVLNMRLSTPNYLIDVSKISDLNYIRQNDGYIAIGALTKHIEIEESTLIKEHIPLLAEAIRYVGHTQIRNRGTIGGSIAHGDPSAELPCVLTALRGEIVITSLEGEVILTPEEFFLTFLLTSLQADQLIKEVRFPVIKKSSGTSFEEVSRRYGDFAIAEVATVVDVNEEGKFTNAQIAVGGVNPVPTVLGEVEEFLIGKQPSNDVFEKVHEITMESVEPESDLHGTAEYRRELAGTLVVRALKKAFNRAQKGEIEWIEF